MAVIKIPYCTSNGNNYVVSYDNSTHSVEYTLDEVTVKTCNSPVNTGDIIYEEIVGELKYIVKAAPEFNNLYATIDVVSIQRCQANIASVNVKNESFPGAGDGQITVDSFNPTILEYYVSGIGWQASNVFNGLSTGQYEVKTRESNSQCESGSRFVTVGVNNAVSASYSKTNLTAPGANDGSITLNVTGGSGSYSYTWSDGATIKDRSGLSAGVFSVVISDDLSGQSVNISNIQILDAEPVVIPDPYFDVSSMQSFHFTRNLIIDGCLNHRTLDNVLYVNSAPKIYSGMCYQQKVNQCDGIFTIQIRSNRQQNKLNIIDQEENVYRSIPFSLVSEYTSRVQKFSIRIQSNGATQSRIYFVGQQSIPVPVSIGDPVEILNNVDGYNGVFTVVNVGLDTSNNTQYLIINKQYTLSSGFSSADVNISVSTLDFNIYEASIDFSSIDVGYYYIEVFPEGEEYLKFVSEPIHVKLNHANTHLIECSNVDNAYDIDYSNNITHKIRIKSVFYKRKPSVEAESLRNTNGSLNILSAKPKRQVTFETEPITPYLVEKLTVFSMMDYFSINKVQFITGEGFEEAEYKEGYGLATMKGVFEQKEWFNTYNGNDLGSVTDDGLIIANEGFIKR